MERPVFWTRWKSCRCSPMSLQRVKTVIRSPCHARAGLQARRPWRKLPQPAWVMVLQRNPNPSVLCSASATNSSGDCSDSSLSLLHTELVPWPYVSNQGSQLSWSIGSIGRSWGSNVKYHSLLDVGIILFMMIKGKKNVRFDFWVVRHSL